LTHPPTIHNQLISRFWWVKPDAYIGSKFDSDPQQLLNIHVPSCEYTDLVGLIDGFL
jgi:hypothetical protein